MRIEVVFEPEKPGDRLEIPWESPEPAPGYLDLRGSPEGIERIEAARQHPPLRTFLTAVNSGDSFFCTARCKTWPEQKEPDTAESCAFVSRVDVFFASEAFNFDRGRYDDLTRRLAELLSRDVAPDVLRVELRVRPCHFRALAREGFCLRILLAARGASPGQAELRWGLGLARIQQALLFTSRTLRQQIAQAS